MTMAPETDEAQPVAASRRTVFRDAALQAEFEREGMVSMTVLDPGQVDRLRDIVLGLSPDDGFDPDGKVSGPVKYHLTELDSNKAYKRRVFEIGREWLGPAIEPLLDGYRLLGVTAAIKPPGKGEVPIHTDWSFQEDLTRPTVYLWCALDDMTLNNGPLRFVPRSHGLFAKVFGPTIIPDFAPALDLLHDSAQPKLMKAGEAVVFDSSIFHRSDDNLTDRPRVAIRLSLIPEQRAGVMHRAAPDREGIVETYRMETEDYFDHDGHDMLHAGYRTVKLSEREQAVDMIEPDEMAEVLRRGASIRDGQTTAADIVRALRRDRAAAAPALASVAAPMATATRPSLYRSVRARAGRILRRAGLR